MKTKDLTKIAICTALTIVLSWISIPIGIVPVTLQILAVFICAIVLKPTHALLSQVVYILLGVIGIPVFALATAGPSVIVGETGGFILTFPLIAFYISFYINLYKNSSKFYILVFLQMLVGLVFCYLVGALRFSFFTNLSLKTSLSYAVLPFVIPDIIKTVVAAFIILPALKHIREE